MANNAPKQGAHLSDSTEQREAELAMISAASTALGVTLFPERVDLPGGAYVAVDGVGRDPLTYVEAFARQGILKGGQVQKIKGDTLKLSLLRHAHPQARCVLVFASPEAARTATTGWIGEAGATFGIEVLVVQLDDALRARLIAAQARQVMVNPTAESES